MGTVLALLLAGAAQLLPGTGSVVAASAAATTAGPVAGLDSTWGVDGQASAFGVRATGGAVVVDGTTYVIGTTFSPSGPFESRVEAFDPNGRLRSTFGSQGGLRPLPDVGLYGDALVPAGQGRLLAVLGAHSPLSSTTELVRFDALTGALDATFGNGGRLQLQANSAEAVVDEQGRTYYALDGYVVRLTIGGQPDETWGPGGRVDVGFVGRGLRRDALGRLLLLDVDRTTGEAPHVLRLLSDGSRDTSFGSGGVAPLPLPADQVEPLRDGRLLAGGRDPVSGTCTAYVLRLTANGATDPTWGVGGQTLLGAAPDPTTVCSAQVATMREDAAGRVDLVLQRDGGSGVGQVVRLLADGRPDPALRLRPGLDDARPVLLRGLALDDAGRITAVGDSGRPPCPACAYGVLARLVDDVVPLAAGFVPLQPSRVLDTRTGIGVPAGRVGPGGQVVLPLLGRSGLPPGGVRSVVLNVTAVAPTAATTFVTVWPSGAAQPLASSLNAGRGETVPGQVTVGLGPDGAVALYNGAGQVDLVADVVGYQPVTGGSGFTAVAPTRVLDTRSTGRLGAGGTVDLTLPGLPVDATAAVLNVTAVGPTSVSFVTAYPAGTARPLASSLNLLPATDTPNLVTVAVRNRTVSFYNDRGTTDLVADLAGYYAPSSTGRFTPLVPGRLVDTRDAPAAPVPAGGVRSVDVLGHGVPVGASAVLLNVTAVDPRSSSFLTVWPSGLTRPLASNLNTRAGVTVANAVLVPVGPDGLVDVYNDRGLTDLVVDVSGYVAG